jgi:hypothetical protein
VTRLTALCLVALLCFGMTAGCGFAPRLPRRLGGEPPIDHRDARVEEFGCTIRRWSRVERARGPMTEAAFYRYHCACGGVQWSEIVREV